MGSKRSGFLKDDDEADSDVLQDEFSEEDEIMFANGIEHEDVERSSDEDFFDSDFSPESGDENLSCNTDSESVQSLTFGREKTNSENDVLKLLRTSNHTNRLQPPDIMNDGTVTHVSFSPSHDIIAVGTIEGDICLYKYDVEKTESILKYSAHVGSCRRIEYDSDGGLIYSISDDKCIIVAEAESGKFKNAFDEAHNDAIYSLMIINNNLFSTGDDGGCVKLWDRRKKDEVFSVKVGTDYVSSLKCLDEASTLVCTAGDGTISAVSTNAHRILVQSQPYDSELTCCDLFCSNTKLAVGTSTGSLLLYSWGHFSSWNDEFPGVDGKKYAINCIIPVTENIAVAGLDNGLMRAINLFPMRNVGIVGQHGSTVECIDINRDGTLLASCSIENKVCFWNIEYFEDVHITDKMATNNDDAREHNLPSSHGVNTSDFFSGLA